MRTSLVVLLLTALVATLPALAGTCTVAGPGGLSLQLSALTAVQPTPAGAVVSGAVLVTPQEALKQGLTAIYYLDDKVQLVSALARPELSLDTRTLPDGVHELRLDVSDGTRLAMSTGSLALHVANDASTAVITQAAPQNPAFTKIYRKLLLREIVWFNGREADLEKHGWIRNGRIYITLTDLMRHVGGTIIWGPSPNYILVERNGVEMRIIPGSARVYVDGEAVNIGQPAVRIENRTYVPIRPILALLGLDEPNWNPVLNRAFVSTQ